MKIILVQIMSFKRRGEKREVAIVKSFIPRLLFFDAGCFFFIKLYGTSSRFGLFEIKLVIQSFILGGAGT